MRHVRIAKKRRSLQRLSSPWKRGWEDGYKQGWLRSYHLGQCQSIVTQSQQVLFGKWNIKVLFVQAQGTPYSSLDQGIYESLRGLVTEVVLVSEGVSVVSLADETRPDLVLVLDALGTRFSAAQADEVRGLGIRTAIWLPDDPYHTDGSVHLVAHFDYVFTMEVSCVQLYRDIGCSQVHYLPSGVNLNCIGPGYVDDSYKHDICFIGSAFWNRVALFDQIAPYLSQKKVKIIGFWWERLENYSLLASKIQGTWITPAEAAKYYNGAKVVINLHRSIDDPTHNSNSRNLPALSVNPRLFEISACGTLQLTDEREELSKFYTPGVEIACFHSADELIQQLDYYLTHEQARRDIALSGLHRTGHEHTFTHRLTDLLQTIFG